MSALSDAATGGREAAIARRKALSAGKTALPAGQERVRIGKREAGFNDNTPAPVAAPTIAAFAHDEPARALAAPEVKIDVSPSAPPPAGGMIGRFLSMQRRKLVSAGKQALQSSSSLTDVAAVEAHAHAVSAECVQGSCKDAARARRAAISQIGRGDAAPAAAPRRTRQGKIEYAPKVADSTTQSGLHVTGLRIGQGANVTGDEPGTTKPVSGTQYIGVETGAGWRAGGPKVGQALTGNGLVVSGTNVRSKVRVTGDEAGGHISITGEAEQKTEDDLTARQGEGASVAAQFARQTNPHGASVFGTNLGRSAHSVGSRSRSRTAAVEATESGMVITGSAVGRSTRVTGDENGACRPITGSQYLAPARRQAACGSSGGGTAPAEQIGADRPDPVTASKVMLSETWGGQKVTGSDVEHNPRVTGDEPGSCMVITGSQYQGRATAEGWCDPHSPASPAGPGAMRLIRRATSAAVTGDTPIHDGLVTGTPGAARDVTGTPYYRESEPAPAAGHSVAEVDASFTVASPQRAAQLRAGRATPENGGASRITGSFAVGGEKITGNTEFTARPRYTKTGDKGPAHHNLTGEGSSRGTRITGDTWDQSGLTGVEGAFAADRNPSEREGKRQNFAGSAKFKGQGKHEDARLLVTGMVGYFNKAGARVTMTGGAQG